jgi:hypothetical protein
MAIKRKNKNEEQTGDIIKKVKSAFMETLVREWLNTREPQWDMKTPLQMIKAGRGQEILDAIKLADEDLKKEKQQPKKEEENDGPYDDNRSTEESVESTTVISNLL